MKSEVIQRLIPAAAPEPSLAGPIATPPPIPDLPSNPASPSQPRTPAVVWILALAAVVFAASTGYLWITRPASSGPVRTGVGRDVDSFWAEVFQPGRSTDIVLEDAAIGFYQELTGRPVPLSGYFDRAYLRTLPETAQGAGVPADLASAITLRRHTTFAGASLLWKVMQVAGRHQASTQLRFARDYSFHDSRANNAILVGNSSSNPWIEPYEPKIGIRWVYDASNAVYSPSDSWNSNKVYAAPKTGEQHREGYCSVAFLPNLGGAGNVLIVSATGGSAINAATDYLTDQESMRALRLSLDTRSPRFPYFEALIRLQGRGASPRDAVRELVRAPKR